jgi:hypothetical protein
MREGRAPVRLRDIVWSVPGVVILLFFGQEVCVFFLKPTYESGSRPSPTSTATAALSLSHASAAPLQRVWPPPLEPAPPASAVATGRAPFVATPPPDRIPGLDAPMLMASLERSGLECAAPVVFARGLRWTCSAVTEQGQYLVTATGPSTQILRSLSAVVSGAPNDALIAMFFASVAAAACREVNAESARSWIFANIDRGGTTNVGPFRLDLAGAVGSRTLDVVMVD